MRKTFVYGLFVLITVSLMGCAGMISGTTQAMTIDSNVKGAHFALIRVNGDTALTAVTPFSGPVPRTKGLTLIMTKDGYAEKTQIVETNFNPVFLLNGFIPFGTFCSTTDIANETMWEYTPSNIYVNLEPASSFLDPHYFQKDTDIKRFVMMNYQQLVGDLGQSKGKYLDALVLELFNAKPENYGEVVARVRQLLVASNQNVVSFGESVSQYYFNSNFYSKNS